MTSGEELLMSLLAAFADLSLVAGWTAEETQNALRHALAGTGDRLGLQRQDVAERLDVSRRILSSWDAITPPRRRQLDVVLQVYQREDVRVAAQDRNVIIEAARAAFQLGLITRNKTLAPVSLAALTAARERLAAAADALTTEKARAQFSLGSRDANTQRVSPEGAAQPGLVHNTWDKKNEPRISNSENWTHPSSKVSEG